MNEKQFDQVLSDGARACAMLEGMMNPSQPVVSNTDLCDVITKLKLLSASTSMSDDDKTSRTFELVCDALNSITADYQNMTSALQAKLEQYKC